MSKGPPRTTRGLYQEKFNPSIVLARGLDGVRLSGREVPQRTLGLRMGVQQQERYLVNQEKQTYYVLHVVLAVRVDS